MTISDARAWMSFLLLVMLSGCATTTLPDSYEDQAASGQVPASSPQPAPSPLPSESPTQPPVARVRPAAPVNPGTGVRTPAGAATRLLNIPAALLAILLWPSTLEGERLSLDWTNTLNPVTLEPWSSQEEYEEFWRLPQPERERLIQAGRNSMGSSKPSGTAPEPRAGPRRHPNQTCDDAVLDHLQAEKNRICNAMPGANCSPSGNSAKRLARIPCSQVRLRIQGVRNCIHIRQFIQDECFGGATDAAHANALDEYRDGLAHCLALEAKNCAPGHPMAEL